LTGPAPFALGAININGTHHSHTGRARAMSSGTGSPSSSYASAGSLPGMGGIGPHRNVKSYTVAGMNGVREKRRRNNLSISKREDDDDDDEDDEDINPSGILPSSEVVVAKRREEIRRQRIESEQRRRDELRDGYRKLKEVLPISNQKSSKVSLLDRATTHIRYLELTTNQMAQKVAELEAETARLRQVNETLMLSAAERSRLGNGF
jgi:hypothetical protein